MAIPENITKQSILDAMQYIDQNGVPINNQSITYDLVYDTGKKYPPKYLISVANHIVNNTELSIDDFNSINAKNLLEKMGFTIETKQEKYELVITSNSITSSDIDFSMNDLGKGDNYKPLDSYFKKSSGEIIRRKYNKGERRNSNQTMPRLACQVFERAISAMSVEEKENFPICQYTPNSPIIQGIFSSIELYKAYRNTLEYLIYSYDNGRQFVFYCWNIFSTIHFIQECLKRFGSSGDHFVLTYRKKDKKETMTTENEEILAEEQVMEFKSFTNPYSKNLIESKNIIFRGAPGTGKTYLAKEIATDIISNGYYSDYTQLNEEQKKQIEFVQFHPSYDYTDFVEGLRPKTNTDGSIGFELQDGIFKRFVARATKNYEDSIKSSNIETRKNNIKSTKIKPYIFIIDEINRGEISKIFGELFFSVDPGYRGRAGEVSTQYANLHDDPNEKFYIPENVYIIGTMNDIDRSVDSFDFAMRRRFRFVEIKADERLEMLDTLGTDKESAIERMTSLNNAISNVEELNDNYHIGASYFMKLNKLSPDQLWEDYLYPLLQDYVRGMYDEESIMNNFKAAFGYKKSKEGDCDNGNQA